MRVYPTSVGFDGKTQYTAKYCILDNKGCLHTASTSIATCMREMAQRWAGKLVNAETDVVLFDIQADRVQAKEKLSAAEARKELALAERRDRYELPPVNQYNC